MSRVVLAMTEAHFNVLRQSLADEHETAFTARFGIAANGEFEDDVTVCVRRIDPVSDDAYLERTSDRLLISSAGFMPGFGIAAEQGDVAGFIHTHPGSEPRHSELDSVVDGQLATVAFCRTGRAFYVSLIVAGTVEAPRFSARVTGASGTREVDLVRVIGSRIRIFKAASPAELRDADREHFDRQIRVFGTDGQDVLRSLSVGIVGAGGTGSAVCEQLTRLGVGRIVLADDDVVTESNVSRIYGSRSSDVGLPKVEVVSNYALHIRGDLMIEPIVGRVTQRTVASRLRHCDVVFGCTDDQLGRSILARLAYWYLVPLFDMGVVIVPKNGRVSEIVGRITVVGPSYSCLLCRGRIRPDVLRAEALPVNERNRLAAEGYVPGLGEPDPSVVTYTTLIAAFATSTLLERLFGFGDNTKAGEMLVQIDRGGVRHNDVASREGHFCADSGTWGAADREPFLGLLWT